MHLVQPGIMQSTAYDSFCVTVMAATSNLTCNVCHLYFASLVMATHHKQAVHPEVKLNEMPEDQASENSSQAPMRTDGYYRSRYLLFAWSHSDTNLNIPYCHIIISANAVCSYPVPLFSLLQCCNGTS